MVKKKYRKHGIIIIGSDSMDDFSQILFETIFSTKESVERIKSRYSKEELEQMVNYQEVEVNDAMERAFGIRPQQVILSRDLLAVFESEETVRQLKPNFVELAKLPGLCVGATAPGKDFDCVSRVFAPKLKVEEDPVTGSTHCLITPYWSKRLGKSKLTAFQASERSGVLYCEQVGNRVKIAGSAELFSIAEILPNYFKK